MYVNIGVSYSENEGGCGMFVNRVMGRMFIDLYSSPDVVRMIHWDMRWTGHVASLGDKSV
jgi:hypothetical protein